MGRTGHVFFGEKCLVGAFLEPKSHYTEGAWSPGCWEDRQYHKDPAPAPDSGSLGTVFDSGLVCISADGGAILPAAKGRSSFVLGRGGQQVSLAALKHSQVLLSPTAPSLRLCSPGHPRVTVLVRCDLPVSPTRAPQVFLVLLAPPDCP